MAKLTRRGFLTSVGAAGVAGGAVAAGALGAGGLSALLGSGSAATAGTAGASNDSIVAYVRGGKGEVNILVGDRQVTTRDPELVRRLMRASQ